MENMPMTVMQVRGRPPDLRTLASGLAEIVREAMRDPQFMREYEEWLAERSDNDDAVDTVRADR